MGATLAMFEASQEGGDVEFSVLGQFPAVLYRLSPNHKANAQSEFPDWVRLVRPLALQPEPRKRFLANALEGERPREPYPTSSADRPEIRTSRLRVADLAPSTIQ